MRWSARAHRFSPLGAARKSGRNCRTPLTLESPATSRRRCRGETGVAAVREPGRGVMAVDEVHRASDRTIEGVARSRAEVAEERLQLLQQSSMGVQAGRVRREEQEASACGPDESPHLARLVGAAVVEHDDVTGLQLPTGQRCDPDGGSVNRGRELVIAPRRGRSEQVSGARQRIARPSSPRAAGWKSAGSGYATQRSSRAGARSGPRRRPPCAARPTAPSSCVRRTIGSGRRIGPDIGPEYCLAHREPSLPTTRPAPACSPPQPFVGRSSRGSWRGRFGPIHVP